MSSDTDLIIPHLSKELNLIGYLPLPYTLGKSCKKKKKIKKGEEECEIVYDSKLMISSLVNVCLELVKQIKVLGTKDDGLLDKVNFENSKLEKQIRLYESEIKKCNSELTALKLTNQHLEEKIKTLEKNINDYKISQQQLIKNSQGKEDLLRHALRKNEAHIFNLHKAVWKQFNLADKNYFPENFKLVQLNQPDFNKLWSTVQHSEAKTREDALKKAVCIFQNNNKNLMEENFFLKTLFLMTLTEIQNTIKNMADKLNLPQPVLTSTKIKDIFVDVEEFDSSAYNKILNKYLTVVKRVCELINEHSFTIADEIFVCWSKIIEEY